MLKSNTKQKPRNLLGCEVSYGCGGPIWTDDLKVMSLASYQAAPPREI